MKSARNHATMFVKTLMFALLAFTLSSCGKVWVQLNLRNVSTPNGVSIALSQTSGPIGTLLTLTSTGGDLSTLQSVTVGGVATIIVNKSTTSAQVLVMPGSTSGAISATTSSGSFNSTSNFTVTATGIPTTQQGSKLVGTGATGAAYQGSSVALSADGNTAIVGGIGDNSYAGAAWVFTRTGSTWSQQGSKLVGTGAIGGAVWQGTSVALSADGNTAIVGGDGDNSSAGAAWVYVP